MIRFINSLGQRNFAPLVVALVLGVGLSLVSFKIVRDWESVQAGLIFKHKSIDHRLLIEQGIADTFEAVQSIGALKRVWPDLTREQFSQFSAIEMGDQPFIQALEWVPRVKASERAAFEAATQRDGFPDFSFTERKTQGHMVSAAIRQEYFPVYFVEPFKGNEAAFGFDVASNPGNLEAMNKARDTGKIVATQRITLVQETGNQYAIIVFDPVYRRDAPADTVEERRENLIGFGLGVLRLGDLINATMSKFESNGSIGTIDMFFFDISAPVGKQFLYPKSGSDKRREDVILERCVDTPIQVGGRNWMITHCPKGAIWDPLRWQSWTTLLAVLAITAMLVVYLVLMLRQKAQAERLTVGLRESEECFRSLIDNLPSYINLKDTEGRFQLFNRKHSQVFNVEDSLGKTSFDIHSKEIAEEIFIQEQKVIETKSVIIQERYFLTKQGVRDFLVTKFPILNESGAVTGIGTIGSDITDRKRVEKALHESEAHFQHTVLNAPIPIILHAEDGEVLMVSKRWTELSGYSHSDIPTIRDWTKRAYGADKKHLKHQTEVINALYDLKEPSQHDACVTTATGENQVWQVHDAPLGKLPDGRRFVISMAVDVTERKRAENALRESEERFRSAFENVAVGNIVIDDRGIIEVFNSAAEKIFGYRSDEVIGENVSMLMPEPDRSNHDKYIQKYFETRKANIVGLGREVTGLRKNGEVFSMHLSVGEMVVGGTRSFVGSISDLTQMKALESQLNQAQKMESIGQLTGGIAHDFNNLMGVILGNLELAESAKTDDERKELIFDAMEAVYRGAALTQQLLSFSRQQPLSPKVVDVNDLIWDSFRLVERTLGEGIEIEIRFSEEPLPVNIDTVNFGTAVLNLSLNARDAMPSGGQLTITTRQVEFDGELTGEDNEPITDPHALITISDTGCGIAKDHLDRVIEPFFTTKEVGKGSGLGLSMVYGFIEQSGGRMEIDSEQGKGTTVSLYLPLTDGKIEKGADLSASYQPISRSRTILVVEDDLSVLKTTSRMLTGLGYEVLEAANGLLAGEVLDEKSDLIDLVFSDVVMPQGMSGVELAKWVTDKYKHIKVLLTSGYPDVARQDSLKSSGVMLLAKPYKRAQLVEAIEVALDS